MTQRHMLTMSDPDADSRFDWRQVAACRDEDPDLFFPVTEEPTDKQPAVARQITDARKVCRECPVLEECLADALRNPPTYGIRAGLTTAERAQRRKAEVTYHRIEVPAGDDHRSCQVCLRESGIRRSTGLPPGTVYRARWRVNVPGQAGLNMCHSHARKAGIAGGLEVLAA